MEISVESDDDDYRVGKNNPPRHTQFKPGHKGHGGGRRPKPTLSEVLDRILAEKLTLKENGRPRKFTREEIILRAIVSKAMTAQPQFCKMLLSYLERRPADSTAKSATKADDILMEELTRMLADGNNKA